MTEAFHQGGWGMYPTLVIGLILLGNAFGFAIAPDARRRALVRTLASLTMLVASLGFVSGLIKSCIAADGAIDLVIRGFGESLNNIGLGIGMLVTAGVATAIGVYRRGDAPADLHGL